MNKGKVNCERKPTGERVKFNRGWFQFVVGRKQIMGIVKPNREGKFKLKLGEAKAHLKI